MSKNFVCIYRGNYFDDGITERLVRVLRITEEVAVSDTTYYMIEDVLTGREVEIGGYNLYFEERFNELETIAWAASQETSTS